MTRHNEHSLAGSRSFKERTILLERPKAAVLNR